MTWLAFVFALELGMLPSGTYAIYDPPTQTRLEGYRLEEHDVTGTYYALFDFELAAGSLFAGGAVKTDVYARESEWTFWPHTAWYSVRAGARYGPVEIGARHYCTHPVVPWLSDARPQWEAAYDELYMRFTARAVLK